MAVGLLLVYLTGLVFSEEPPDVKCLVVNVDYVHCMWNGSATPDVNYTFYSRFKNGFIKECASYVLENTTVVGCDHPYENLISERFAEFTTTLVLVNRSFEKNHSLKSKVKLNAPVYLSVKNGTDLNLWYYWNYSLDNSCIESEVRHRINGKKWKNTIVQEKSYCINLPSNSYLYELQVRGRIEATCGQSDFWSDWSPPVFWGSMREPYGTGTNRRSYPFPAQTTMFCAVGAIVFVGLAFILVRHERLRIILIPILPDPGKNLTKILADGNVEEWLPISKSIKEGYKANYNEHVCPVREYTRIPQNTSESSTDQSSSDQSSSDQTSSEQSSGSCASLAATD